MLVGEVLLLSCDWRLLLVSLVVYTSFIRDPAVCLLIPSLSSKHLWTNAALDRFYGFSENSREANMDMREMVDKVKTGQPLYGTSQVSPYLQGVAARNSRFSELFIHVIPWFNVVNHDQVRPFPYFPCSLLYFFVFRLGRL